jgi:hypothetical protein
MENFWQRICASAKLKVSVTHLLASLGGLFQHMKQQQTSVSLIRLHWIRCCCCLDICKPEDAWKDLAQHVRYYKVLAFDWKQHYLLLCASAQEYGFLGLVCLQLCWMGLIIHQKKEKGSLEPDPCFESCWVQKIISNSSTLCLFTEVVTDRVFSIMGENNVGGVGLTCTLTFFFWPVRDIG